MNRTEITIEGQRLHLLPEKALWWPAASILLIADTHFGKEATFRAHGIPITDDSLKSDLERLSTLLKGTEARRLIVLGDLLHSRMGRTQQTLAKVTDWRARHPLVAIDLVQGNHDRAAGRPLDEWNIRSLPAQHREGPFVLSHYPDPSENGFVLAGHLHPKVRLFEQGRSSIKLPCFWFRNGVAVLPAFGTFIDSAVITPDVSDRVFAISDSTVHEIPSRPLRLASPRR